MNALVAALRSGVGVARHGGPATRIPAAARAAGCAYFRVGVGGVVSKYAVLAAFRRGMGFPAWFGHNWDALADCLGDLSWCDAAGYVVAVDGLAAFARSQPGEFDTLLDILRESAQAWQSAGKPFSFVLTDAPQQAGLTALG